MPITNPVAALFEEDPIRRDHVDVVAMSLKEVMYGLEVLVVHPIIGVEKGDPLGCRMIEPEIAGRGLSTVLFGQDANELWATLLPAAEHFERLICRAVIDHDDLDVTEIE